MNIIVFDTETIGMSSRDLLNLGYHIIDLNPTTRAYEVLVKRDMIDYRLYARLTELHKFKGALEEDMPNILSQHFLPIDKKQKYDYLIENKAIEKHTPQKMLSIFQEDIKRYKVVFGYAYNSKFDIDVITKSALKYQVSNPLTIPIFDIWAYSINHICRTDDYIMWARENQVFTASEQYISTSVESVVKYLTDNLDFVEEHTALDDTKWETLILCECTGRGCDITRAETRGANVASGKVFNKVIVQPSGERLNIEYNKVQNRANNEYYYLKEKN